MSLDNAIWLIGPLTETLVIALLLYRRTWRTLPLFCTYCIWDVLSNLAVFLVGSHYPRAYFHVYFTQAIVDSVLMFCVLVELAWSVLRPIRTSLPRSAVVLIGVLVLVAGAAIWPFVALPALAHATSREGLLFTQLEQTSSILRILVFVVLAGGSQLLSIGWRDRELQVATGFGLYSVVSLTVAVLQTHQTTAAQYLVLERIGPISYFVSLIYWVFAFAQKEAERREFTPQMRSFLLAVAGTARSQRVSLTEPRAGKPPGQKND